MADRDDGLTGAISSELLVSDGIFFVTFNPNTVHSANDGLRLYFFSFATSDLSLVTSSPGIFAAQEVSTGINDVVLFTIDRLQYLAVARDSSCFLYEFRNSGSTSELKLRQKFKHSAKSVKFFTNSYGIYLIFVCSEGKGSTYLHSSGEFIQMQNLQEWGTGEWTSQGLPTGGSFLLPEQELIFLGNTNFGNTNLLKFLKFDTPGILVDSSSVSIVAPDGCSITGLSFGRKLVDPTSSSTVVADYYYFIVCKVITADGNLLLFFHGVTVSEEDDSSFTNLGGLANSVLKLEQIVAQDQKTLAELKGELSLVKLSADKNDNQVVLTAQSVTITGTTSVDLVTMTLLHNTTSIPTFSSIDYNQASSDLATSVLDSTIDSSNDNYLYKNSILKSGAAPITLGSGGQITAPTVTTFKADVAKLDTRLVKGENEIVPQNMDTFLTNSFMTVGPQSFPYMFIFLKSLIVTDTTEFKMTADSQMPIEPQKYIDTSKPNTLSNNVLFTNVHFMKAPTFSATVNNIALEDLITTNDANAATFENPIDVKGEKTFSAGVTFTSTSIAIETINGRPSEDILNGNFLYKEDSSVDNFEQTVTCDSFYFRNIKVRKELTMPSIDVRISGILSSFDVSATVLADIVVTNEDNGDVSGVNTFSNDVVISNLRTSTINNDKPAELLLNGFAQDIQAKIEAKKLVTADLSVNNINKVNLITDVARTDIANTFTAPIVFTGDFIVSTNIDVAVDKTIGGVDVSELVQTQQNYEGTVTVLNSLVIDQTDFTVNNMDFGVADADDGTPFYRFTNIPVDKVTFDNYFLFKDSAQELPNLATVSPTTTLHFEELTLGTTMNGLDLTADVVHTSGEETTTYEGIRFDVETTFKDDIKIETEDGVDKEHPRIGGVDVKALHEQIFCPNDDIIIAGVKTLKEDLNGASEVTSYFDITVGEHGGEFIANGRNFKAFTSSDVAVLSSGSQFAGKMTFAQSNSIDVSPDIDVTGDFAVSMGFDITANDLDTVLLNGKNIKDFESKIVKTNDEYNAIVTSPLEFSHLTVSMSGIINPGDKIDNHDPVEYLDARVLLDDSSNLAVELTSPTITFMKGVTVEAGSANSDTYFADNSLATYKDSLFVPGTSEVSGKKTVAAGNSLTVDGDITFGQGLHPFGVDITTLQATGLTKSSDQTIELDYTINSISKVEKIISDKIDGAVVADICRIDQDCTIACPVDTSPCVTFSKTITTTNGINIDEKLEGIDMSEVLGSLASNDNAYRLEKLEVPNGDFSWTTDVGPVEVSEGEADTSTSNTVSDLYKNLVVKSDQDWSQTIPDNTVVQDVIASVKFKESITFNDITLDSTKINEDSTTEVNPELIISDSAKKTTTNEFTESKTFKDHIVAKTATVKKLVGINEINDLNIADYRTKALVTDDEVNPGNEDFVQTVTGDWTLSNGFKISDRLSVHGTVDGVEVEDFVRENYVSTREIPAVSFNEGATVSGNIVTTDTLFQTDLDNFFKDTIKIDEASSISQNLKFTGDVKIETDVAVTKLNNIPANTWVQTGGKTEEQVITAKKTFSQETVSVKGNLLSDNIADIDLSAKFADAMKTDEDATITIPSLVEFSAKTTLTNENFNMPIDNVFNTLLDDFVADISVFVKNLYKFYSSNIIDVLPAFLREVDVAKQLDLGELSYMEELNTPAYLTMKGNDDMFAMSVSAVKMDNSLYSLNFVVNSTSCGMSDPCPCQDSRLVSSLDKSGSPNNDKTFSFSLPSGVFTLSSQVESYSDSCNDPIDGTGLIMSGILADSVTASANLALLSPVMVGVNLVPQDLNTVATVGYVAEAEMWELGQTVYLAVASTYNAANIKPYVQLYKMDISPGASDMVWVAAGKIVSEDNVDIGPVMRLKAVKFTDFTGNQDSLVMERVHLFAGRSVTREYWGQPLNDIWVFEMSMTGNTITPATGMKFLQKIAVPGMVEIEVLVYQEGAFTEPEVMLIVAANLQLDLSRDSAMVSSFVFDTTSNNYMVALLTDNVQMVGDRLVKMVSAKVARHTIVFLAETSRLSLYRYVPYQGLRLVGSLKAGVILDFTVYSEWGAKGEQVMVYMLEEGPKAKLYTLKVSGTVPTVKIGKIQREAVFTKYAFVDLLPAGGSRVTGRLSLAQGPGYVRIYGEIFGLEPGYHGFHVHEYGETGNSCDDAGGHFNPDGNQHSAPGSASRHAGDLGNVVTPGNSEVTSVDVVDRWVSLGDGGFRDVAGRAIVVHADQDDHGEGVDESAVGSKQHGNAGARVACGVIKIN
eukprot:GFUD01044997.1.p1 GENE.GFUD01044997.1~~GFUD01044997.1.p1  ORF type:complete len:2578 (+),score=536.89 GFUD01044997.1:946-7734(+)